MNHTHAARAVCGATANGVDAIRDDAMDLTDAACSFSRGTVTFEMAVLVADCNASEHATADAIKDALRYVCRWRP